MQRTTITLTSPGMTLAVDSRSFTLRRKGRKISSIPSAMIDNIIIYPEVEVTRKAMETLATLGIPVTFIKKNGCIAARLTPPWRSLPAPRIEQSRIFLDPKLSLLLAKRQIDAKIANSAAFMRQHADNHPNPKLRETATQLYAFRKQVANATDTASLFGYEGIAAKTYFSSFSEMLRIDWTTFTQRTRRPPTDPVNSLLSYIYAALTQKIHSNIEANELDPYISYLHNPEYRRPSLALDLMEPFRAIIADRLTLRLLNLGILREEHFEKAHFMRNDIRITWPGREEILKAAAQWIGSCSHDFGKELNSPHYLLEKEIERYAQSAKAGNLANYQPYYLNEKDAQQCPALEP